MIRDVAVKVPDPEVIAATTKCMKTLFPTLVMMVTTCHRHLIKSTPKNKGNDESYTWCQIHGYRYLSVRPFGLRLN